MISRPRITLSAASTRGWRGTTCVSASSLPSLGRVDLVVTPALRARLVCRALLDPWDPWAQWARRDPLDLPVQPDLLVLRDALDPPAQLVHEARPVTLALPAPLGPPACLVSLALKA